MSILVLVVVYLVVFVLLQIAIYRYLREEDDQSQTSLGHVPNTKIGAHRDPSMTFDSSVDSVQPTFEEDVQMDVDDPTKRCHNCGATNAAEPAYTYCWQCVSPLGR